jgi:hypothetical protein
LAAAACAAAAAAAAAFKRLLLRKMSGRPHGATASCAGAVRPAVAVVGDWFAAVPAAGGTGEACPPPETANCESQTPKEVVAAACAGRAHKGDLPTAAALVFRRGEGDPPKSDEGGDAAESKPTLPEDGGEAVTQPAPNEEGEGPASKRPAGASCMRSLPRCWLLPGTQAPGPEEHSCELSLGSEASAVSLRSLYGPPAVRLASLFARWYAAVAFLARLAFGRSCAVAGGRKSSVTAELMAVSELPRRENAKGGELACERV